MARPLPFLLRTDLALLIFALALPGIFSLFSGRFEKALMDLLLYPMFLTLSFLAGAGVGIQFPLAAKSYHDIPAGQRAVGQIAALIYGADLLGGFFGGLLGGVLLLPVLGLWETCLVVTMIKASSCVLLLLSKRPATSSSK